MKGKMIEDGDERRSELTAYIVVLYICWPTMLLYLFGREAVETGSCCMLMGILAQRSCRWWHRLLVVVEIC